MSLEFLMKKEGFSVFIARNGEEALQLLNQTVPDLVLLDIMMPDIDGFQICKIIKSDDKLKNAHVIFISAKTRDLDVKKGLDAGAAYYFTKPFSTRELTKKLKELLQ